MVLPQCEFWDGRDRMASICVPKTEFLISRAFWETKVPCSAWGGDVIQAPSDPGWNLLPH